MTYTLDLSEGLSVLGVDHQHSPISGRILITLDTRSRWVELNCSCGSSMTARWGAQMSTYRDLLLFAWTQSCGSIARPAV